VYRLGEEVGFLLGRAGAVLICGGGSGVMEAAARGARKAGGLTVGILPGNRDGEANPFIDIPIVTGLGNARNVINILTSQAVIAIHGAYGTLSEIALAMKCRTPVIGLDTWKLTPPPGADPALIIAAASPEEAVQTALKHVKIGEKGG
jgi:uncharacterized protein (TIGR00725 family)